MTTVTARAGRLSLRAAIAELRRLRAENTSLAAQLAELRGLVVALVNAIDHDAELSLVRMWYRDGYAAAELVHADDYERGFHDGVISLKRAQQDAYRLAETDMRRWAVRGERRSRKTFSEPHPADYPGLNGAA